MAVSTKSPSSYAEPIFCVVTRIFDAELPYVGSFIRHYTKMGVQKFYFVNTHRAQFKEVNDYIARHAVEGIKIKVINTKNDNRPVNGMQNEALHKGMADFVINVDVDEYWILPPSIPDLRTLVRRRPADHYQFCWLMVPFDEISGTPTAPYYGFWGHQSKYMVRHSCLRRLGIHRPYLKGGGGKPAKHTTCGCAVHFWGRGFKDVLLKVVGQKIGNSKTSSKEELLQLSSEGDIPNRLKLLAYFCRQPRTVPLKAKSSCKLLEIDVAKEDELLGRKLLAPEFDLVHKVYLCFADRLSSKKLWATLPQYGSGIGDLGLVDHLEPIRAIPLQPTPSKRVNCHDTTPPPKRLKTEDFGSDRSTAAESCPTLSGSEDGEPCQASPPKA